MYIVLLKFPTNKEQAVDHVAGHKAWIEQGFDDGVFLTAGPLQPALGGCVLANNTSLEALQARVNTDPFVERDIVSAEIIEYAPNRTEARLDFLTE